jgi:hypothetical protein
MGRPLPIFAAFGSRSKVHVSRSSMAYVSCRASPGLMPVHQNHSTKSCTSRFSEVCEKRLEIRTGEEPLAGIFDLQSRDMGIRVRSREVCRTVCVKACRRSPTLGSPLPGPANIKPLLSVSLDHRRAQIGWARVAERSPHGASVRCSLRQFGFLANRSRVPSSSFPIIAGERSLVDSTRLRTDCGPPQSDIVGTVGR